MDFAGSIEQYFEIKGQLRTFIRKCIHSGDSREFYQKLNSFKDSVRLLEENKDSPGTFIVGA